MALDALAIRLALGPAEGDTGGDAALAVGIAPTEAGAREALADLVAPGDESDPAARLFRTQLTLVWLQIDALRTHADEWLRNPTQDGVAGTAAGNANPS